MRLMSKFIEKVSHGRRFELCGRMIRDGKDLVVFIDEVGRFMIPEGRVITTLTGLAESDISGPIQGIARLSESGKGFYLTVRDSVYVTQVSRVRAVFSGEHRKGPVSRVKEERELSSS